jgi:cyanobactin biosynthesis protein (PatB/AcyB/McaB family)
MRLPIQAKPVKRPELIQPHTTVHVEYRDVEGLARISHTVIGEPPG